MPTNNKNKEIEYPEQAVRDELVRIGLNDFWLSGFENNNGGYGCQYNFVFSNGYRT